VHIDPHEAACWKQLAGAEQSAAASPADASMSASSDDASSALGEPSTVKAPDPESRGA
jgi:hypothetical protein